MALPKVDELIKQWKKSHSEALRALIVALDAEQPLAELDGLAGLKIAEVAERLRPFAKPARADDPRLTRVLEPIIREVVWSSDGSKPAWRAIFAAVAASGDARFKQLAPEFKVRPLMREWLVSAWAKAIEGLPATTGTRPDDAKWTAALEALPKKKAPAGARDEAALLADVFARPADDGPRLVYADFLQERGDPRGEFIALQCGARDEKKEKALLKAHGKKWLGPIAPVLGAEFEFRRGFVSKGFTKFKAQRDAEKYGVLPDWATFEELEWREPGASSFSQRKWTRYVGPHFRHLKVALGPHFTSLLEAKEPWAFEYLRTHASEPDDLQRFSKVASTLFPKLTTLELTSSPTPGWFAGVTSLGHVTRLKLGSNSDLAALLKAISDTGVTELWFGDELRFTRDASGKFTLLDFHVTEDTEQRYLFGTAQRVPPGFVTRLTFGARRPDDPKVVALLEERVRAKGGADPFAPKPAGALPTLERPPPMTWLDAEHLLLAVNGAAHVVEAAKLRVVREFPIDRFLAVRSFDGGRAVLGLQNAALVCIDVASGATRFELAIPWHSGNRLNVSPDGKRALLPKGTLVDLEKQQAVPAPRGAKDASFRAFDDSFWLQWKPREPYSVRRLGSRDAVPLEKGERIEGLHEVGGALIGRTDEALARWDVTSGAQTHALEMPSEVHPRIPLCVSDDGARLAVSERPGRVLVVSTADLSVLGRFDYQGTPGGLALSPDGTKLAAIIENALRVFEVR